MKSYSRRGFTIVEVTIVITVIAILASLTLVVYNKVQMEARDTKRKNDVALLASKLEKYYDANGEYPPSCTQANYNVGTATCNPTGSFSFTKGQPLNAVATNATLQTVLPGVDASVKDPRGTMANAGTTNNTFGESVASAQAFGYMYSGGFYTASATDVTATNPTPIKIHGIACTYNLTTNASLSTSFILAYYSESEDKVYFVLSQRGPKPAIEALAATKCAVA